jgi:hypothetical protein
MKFALSAVVTLFALTLAPAHAAAPLEPLGAQPARGAKPSVFDLRTQVVYLWFRLYAPSEKFWDRSFKLPDVERI